MKLYKHTPYCHRPTLWSKQTFNECNVQHT